MRLVVGARITRGCGGSAGHAPGYHIYTANAVYFAALRLCCAGVATPGYLLHAPPALHLRVSFDAGGVGAGRMRALWGSPLQAVPYGLPAITLLFTLYSLLAQSAYPLLALRAPRAQKTVAGFATRHRWV
jgi:hypothetical protein